MALWSCIREFQTLIVGVIGFAGVIGSLLLNAWVARCQRREERRHQRQTLRAALIEELKINRGALAPEPAQVGDGYFAPTYAMDDTYRAFASQIGLLSQAEVSKVMLAYLSLRDYDAKLFLVGQPRPADDRHVLVPAQNVPRLHSMNKDLIDPIEEAIAALERARDAG